MKTRGLATLTLLLAALSVHAEELNLQQLFKNARIDCSDPSSVIQKGILENDSAYKQAYTQAVVEIKNGTATYYAGSFDETELDGIVKLKMTLKGKGLAGGNKKYSLGIADGGKSVVFQDFSYGTEWMAADCKVSQS